MSDQNKAAVQQPNAAIRTNDLEAFLVFYTDDVRWIRVGERSAAGKAELRRLIESLGDAPPPSNVMFDAIVAEGNLVVAFGQLIGEGEDGETAHRAFCDVYRFRGDKIAEQIGFLVRTGAVLKRRRSTTVGITTENGA